MERQAYKRTQVSKTNVRINSVYFAVTSFLIIYRLFVEHFFLSFFFSCRFSWPSAKKVATNSRILMNIITTRPAASVDDLYLGARGVSCSRVGGDGEARWAATTVGSNANRGA